MPIPTDAELLARSHHAVLGHRMIVHDVAVDRYISSSLMQHGCYEPWETELVTGEIRPGDVVVDVGANIGYYTLLFARLVGPTGQVIAFEPDPLNFAMLKVNVELNGYANVVLVNSAVAATSGGAVLFHCSDNAGDHRVYDSADGRPGTAVATVRLDDYFAADARVVPFVKFDIQGAEFGALTGMTAFLRRHARMRMIVEFWPHGLEKALVPPAALLDLLTGHGFKLYEMDEEQRSLIATDAGKLMAKYPVESRKHTNLFCVKAAWAF